MTREDGDKGSEHHSFRFKPHGDVKHLSRHSSFENQVIATSHYWLVCKMDGRWSKEI